MNEIILVKNGEIALKGLNRSSFEETLIRNIKRRLKPLGSFEVTKAQSAIYIRPITEGIDLDDACERLGRVFGIAGFSRAAVVEKDMDVIIETAKEYLGEQLANAKTYKVFAKRADKSFQYKSPEIQLMVGEALGEAFRHLTVDVKNPEVAVTVEIRENSAYIHGRTIKGAGGMPVSSSGEGMLLISGGIDSPVAGYMMARRGMKVSAIHFVSPPYTSIRALQKVESLLSLMSRYTGDIVFYCVPFTKLQEALRDNCPEELFTVLMRRIMMKIAERTARTENIPALITGESLAQVASQTVYALAATNAAANMPVLRPLIGMDKQDIIEISKKIGTFETSILPYEDCCTVFTPKRPKTRPSLEYVEKSEALYDFEPLISEAIANIERKIIKNS